MRCIYNSRGHNSPHFHVSKKSWWLASWVSSWLPTRCSKVLLKSADCAERCNDYFVGLQSLRVACCPVPLEEVWLDLSRAQKLPRGPTVYSAIILVPWHIHKAANLTIKAQFQLKHTFRGVKPCICLEVNLSSVCVRKSTISFFFLLINRLQIGLNCWHFQLSVCLFTVTLISYQNKVWLKRRSIWEGSDISCPSSGRCWHMSQLCLQLCLVVSNAERQNSPHPPTFLSHRKSITSHYLMNVKIMLCILNKGIKMRLFLLNELH